MAACSRLRTALGANPEATSLGADQVLAETPPALRGPPPTAPALPSGPLYGALVLLGIVAIALAGAVTAARFNSMKRRQEQLAMVLRTKLSDALLLEPSLSDYSISVIVHVPLRRRSPVTVDVAGSVPSPELRRAALELVTRQAGGIGREIRIEDRMAVDPAFAKHAA